jgi:hypothetical protein
MAKDEKGHGSDNRGGEGFGPMGAMHDRWAARGVGQHSPNHGEPIQHPQAAANALDVHAEVSKIFGHGGRYDNTAERNQKGGMGQAHYAFHERGK